jgi:hypothetical protein
MGLLNKAISAGPPASRPPAAKLPVDIRTVEKALEGFWRAGSTYQGIILERSGDAGSERFFARASSMAASFGRSFRLPSGDALILFSPGSGSPSRDRDLITHRLVKTLRTRALAVFHAGSPEEALSRAQGVSKP